MNQHVTIDDVAAAAGFSRSTVSLVLNGHPTLKPNTVEQVRRTIVELGYEAAPPGRRLGRRDSKPRMTNRVALLAPGLARAAMNSPVYMDVLHGVEAGVRESGKSLMLLHLQPNTPCPMPLFPQKVDGVLLFGATNDARLTRRLNGTACVQVMGRIERDGVWDHVTYDNSKVGELASEYLLACGHRQAAFVSCKGTGFFGERGDAFRQALKAAGAESLEFIDENLQEETGSVIQVNPERVQALLDRVLAAEPRPTAIFLAADTLAPAVCGELQRRGLVPGRDLGIISCNNEQMLLNHLRPRPATIDIHAELVGKKAVEQLLWRIEHPRQPRVTTALQPTLVAGQDISEDLFSTDNEYHAETRPRLKHEEHGVGPERFQRRTI